MKAYLNHNLQLLIPFGQELIHHKYVSYEPAYTEIDEGKGFSEEVELIEDSFREIAIHDGTIVDVICKDGEKDWFMFY